MVNHVDPLKVQPPPTPRRVLTVKMLEPLDEVGVEPHSFSPHPQGPSGLVGVVQPLVKIPNKDHPHMAQIHLEPGDSVGKQKVPDPADGCELPIPFGLWYKMGPITEDIMRGMFEHVYRARKKPPAGKRHIEDHAFNIEKESAQRPRDQITEDSAVKRRKLTESTEVIKARKARKLQEKAAAKEEKRVASEKKKQAVENAKKARAAATAAKARERKKRRAKPPLAKRAREDGAQGDHDPGGPRTKQDRTGPEKDRDQPTNHVNRTTRNSNKDREQPQGATFSNNTVVSNINKSICAKGDG
jgi:hypothetical protein